MITYAYGIIFFKIRTLHKKCCELYLYCITICRPIHYAKPLIMEVFDLVGLTFGIGGFGSNTFNVDILEIIDSFFRWCHTWSIPFIMFSDYYHNFNTYFKYIKMVICRLFIVLYRKMFLIIIILSCQLGE